MPLTTRLQSMFQSTPDCDDTNHTAEQSVVFTNDTITINDVESRHPKQPAENVLEPGGLSVDEDTSGGLGRHVGLMTATFLM